GDVVAGTVDLVASRTGGALDGSVARSLHGDPLETREGVETAEAAFEVSGWQPGLIQDVRVNGQTLNPPRADVNGTMRLEIPEGVLREGANSLRISTGSASAAEDTTRNNDDFNITDPRIELGNSGVVLRDP